MLKTTVALGTAEIEVEAETIERLMEEAAYIQSLNTAAEGRPDCKPFHRNIKGFNYYGLRDPSGAEVNFGQKMEAPAGRKLFAYSRSSDGYKGFHTYEPNDPPPAPAEQHREDPRKAAGLEDSIQYIKNVASSVRDNWTGMVDGERVNIKQYVRENWAALKTSPRLAGDVAAAIEKMVIAEADEDQMPF